MPLSVEEYKKQLADADARIAEKKEEKKRLTAESDEIHARLSNAETEQRTAEFKMHGLKQNKWWLIFAILAIASIIISMGLSLFQMRLSDVENFAEGFTYNGVPLILVILFFLFGALSVVFFISKKKNVDAVNGEINTAKTHFEAQKTAFDAQKQRIDAADEELRTLEKKKEELKNALYADHPEELAKVKAAKEAEKQRAIDELRREEEINLKAAEDAKKKAEDMMLGQKMFDHPQGYILDGQFENEYQVLCASAELGCEDAQIRICEILLGIVYKSGVKTDIAKGEETALRYASAGNNALYEILGKAYLYGEGSLEKDEAKGLKYLERAAAKGRQKAMIMAAVCNYNGVGTEKNEQRARYYFERAANQGNEQAIRVIVAMDNGEKLKL